MFTAALSHQPKSPTTYEWTSPMWSTHTISCVSLPPRSRQLQHVSPPPASGLHRALYTSLLEYYSAIKRKDLPIHATTWKNPENTRPYERIQTQKTMSCMIPFIRNVQNRQIQRARSRCCQGMHEWGGAAKGTGFCPWVKRMCWN